MVSYRTPWPLATAPFMRVSSLIHFYSRWQALIGFRISTGALPGRHERCPQHLHLNEIQQFQLCTRLIMAPSSDFLARSSGC